MSDVALAALFGLIGILAKTVFDYWRGAGQVKKETAEAGAISQQSADDAEARYSRDLSRQASRIDQLEQRADTLSKRLTEEQEERRKERHQLSQELFSERDQRVALQKQVNDATQDRVRLDKAEALVAELEKKVAKLEATITTLEALIETLRAQNAQGARPAVTEGA